MFGHPRMIPHKFEQSLVGLLSKKLFQSVKGGHPGSRCDSFVQDYGEDLLSGSSAAKDFLLGMEPGLGTWGGEKVGQINRISLFQIGKSFEFPRLGNDPRDVSTRSSLETGIAPASDEKSPGTVTIDIRNPSAFNKAFLFLGEAWTVRSNSMNVQLAASPVTHHGNIVVLFRPARFLEEHASCSGSAPYINQCGDNLAGVAFKQPGVSIFSGLYFVDKAHVPSTAVIGVPASEEVHEGINGYVVNVT